MIRFLPLLVAVLVAAAPAAQRIDPDITVTFEDGVCYAETHSIATNSVNTVDDFREVQVVGGTALTVRNATDATVEVAVLSRNDLDLVVGSGVIRIRAGSTGMIELEVYAPSRSSAAPLSIRCRTGTAADGRYLWVEAAPTITLPDSEGTTTWLIGEPFNLRVVPPPPPPPPPTPGDPQRMLAPLQFDTGGMRPKPGGDD